MFPNDAPLAGHLGLLPGLDLGELKLMLHSPVDVLMAVSHVLLATMTAGLPREDSLSLACHVLSLASKMRILFSEVGMRARRAGAEGGAADLSCFAHLQFYFFFF